MNVYKLMLLCIYRIWLIKIYFHCRLIIIVCQVYIVILYVLYDDVYMYKCLQLKCLFCKTRLSLEQSV